MPKTLRVLFLAAEAEPFVKIGGLGDVAGSLPRALRTLPAELTDDYKLDVRLVLPLHAVVQTESTTLRPAATFSLRHAGGEAAVQVYQTSLKGLPVYFIAGEPINASGSVYSANAALDGEKYTFFSLAALELCRWLNWQPAILHANDWHAALALYALKVKPPDERYVKTSAVLTLHNLPFMGANATGRLSAYDLPLRRLELPDWAVALPLPLGLWAADAIVAVSPTYAQEILTPEHGCGLHDFLRRRREAISGILNGLDVQAYDPETDSALEARFNFESLASRLENKIALQERLGLPKAPSAPLLGMVTRLEPQKGVDLALEALSTLADLPWQAVILGRGDQDLERDACCLQMDMRERVRAEIRFDAQLARQIYGGADIFLMPSRYEPCGMAQMIAMRYGCVPVVRAVGGLKDTVQGGQTGFLFEEATVESLAEIIRTALQAYADGEQWRRLQRNGMAQDFSWTRSAKQYFDLYRALILAQEKTR